MSEQTATTRMTADPDLAAHVQSVVKEYAPYINKEPGLLSLLYDIDLLPEQLLHVLSVNPVAAGSNCNRMIAVCALWKRQAPKFKDQPI